MPRERRVEPFPSLVRKLGARARYCIKYDFDGNLQSCPVRSKLGIVSSHSSRNEEKRIKSIFERHDLHFHSDGTTGKETLCARATIHTRNLCHKTCSFMQPCIHLNLVMGCCISPLHHLGIIHEGNREQSRQDDFSGCGSAQRSEARGTEMKCDSFKISDHSPEDDPVTTGFC